MDIVQNILTSANLSFDVHPSLHEDKEVNYMLNGDFSSQSNSHYQFYAQNTNSNKLCFDFGKKIEGVITLDDDSFAILFQDEISLFDSKNCTNVSLVVDSCLNIKNARGVYKFTKHGRTIYFIDENDGLRFFNIDKPYPKKKEKKDCNDCEDKFTQRLDCDALKVWKCIEHPKLKLEKSNGRLPSGKYQIAIAFTQDKLRFSDYFVYPNIFTVAPNEKSSLNIKFECFNQYFDEYELVLISYREDRGLVAQTVAYLDTAVTEFTINEVDQSNYIPLDTKVLFSKKPYYQKFQHIEVNGTTTEGQLILGGLQERKPINYWNESFNIKAEWVEIRVPAKEAHKLPSFLRDEVYSFEIGWIYCDGQISTKTHIPNTIVLKPEWNTVINNNDTWQDECNEKPKKYWEIYNTAEFTGCTLEQKTKQIEICDYTINVNGTINLVASVYLANTLIDYNQVVTSTANLTALKDSVNAYGYYEDTTYEIIETNCRTVNVNYEEKVCAEEQYSDEIELCEYKITNRGSFGYWESRLTYPNHSNFDTDKGNFKCKGIRHFKFPDNKISPHHVTIDNKEYVNLLTVQFSNIERPKDCDGNYIKDVVGYIIYVTDRNNHKSILHKGLVSNMWEEQLSDCSISYYNNYPFNDLNPDVFLSKTLTHGDIRNSFKPVTNYSKNRFTYISPDVDYIRNNTGEEIRIYSEETGFVNGNYFQTNEFPKIKFLSDSFYTSLGETAIGVFLAQILLNANVVGTGSAGGAGTSSLPIIFESFYKMLSGFLPYDNYGVNYFSRGNYIESQFDNVQLGNIRRRLNYSNYLLPIKQVQDNDKINNYQREQGLYLKLNKDIQDPKTKEYSRVRRKDSNCAEFGNNFVFNPATNQSQRATCSSYYVGIKTSKPTQYGNLNNAVSISKWFTYDLKNFNTTDLIFGGDVYITKHKKLRKFPFFTNLPPNSYNDVGIEMSRYFNVWKPRFYMDYINKNPILGSLQNLPIVRGIVDIFDKSPFNFEYGNQIDKKNCQDEANCIRPTAGDILAFNVGGRFWRNDGSFYTHAIGIQEYWCESEFISDYRETNEIVESNLNVDETELIKYNRIQNPELSLYNLQYIWNGIFASILSASTNVNCCCEVNTDQTRIIFSQANNIESLGDKWQSFLPLNYHQFTNTYGKMVGIQKVNDGNIMFIFEDATFITQNNTGLLTDKGIAYLGEGSIFNRNMKQLPGSQDMDSFVTTPYGIFWCNRKLKEFYFYDGQLNNITDGIRSWANEFLIGDVKGIFDGYSENVYWSSDKWTISFKPKAKNWISFHSFIPDRYIKLNKNFITQKGTGFWKHNDKYNYQNYYGVQYPFIVGINVNNKFELKALHSIELYADFIKEHGYNSKEYTNDFFDKVAVFSQKTSTGLQKILSNKVEDVLNPKFTRLNEGKYRLNGFKNYSSGQPIIEYDNMEYKFINLNPTHEGNIVGFNNQILLSSEKNLKVLIKLNLSIEQSVIK